VHLEAPEGAPENAPKTESSLVSQQAPRMYIKELLKIIPKDAHYVLLKGH
jgi:hypothetical protein